MFPPGDPTKAQDVPLTQDECRISNPPPGSSQQSRTHQEEFEHERQVARGSPDGAGGSPPRSGSPWRRPATGLWSPVKDMKNRKKKKRGEDGIK